MNNDQTTRPKLASSAGFWILSQGYRDAADAVYTRMQGDYVGFALHPCIFLYFRSIELALKAVLVSYDVPENTITRVCGHRLTKLIERAEAFVEISLLGISANDREILERFSMKYSDKWFEYPDNFWDAIPERENLRTLAHMVCEKVQIHIKKRPLRRTSK